jgi:protein TonB
MSSRREISQRNSAEPDNALSEPSPQGPQVPQKPLHSDARELSSKSRRSRPDPMARVRALGERQNRYGMTVGLALALSVHGAGAAHSFTALIDMGAFAALVQSMVRDDIRATYAVEVAPAKPPPPPPEEPPPPEPEPQPKAANRNVPAEATPPPPAQAGKVLTAAPDPDAPLDLTGDGFVTGDGDRYVGGVTSAKGTSTTAVRQAQTKIGGKIGNTGTGKTDSAATRVDLSRPSLPVDSAWNDCGFPPEADTDQINFMRVRIMVTVGIDGRAQKVAVLSDPGHGFGRQAQQCAFRKSYSVALNTEGKPVVSTTPPFGVTFTR